MSLNRNAILGPILILFGVLMVISGKLSFDPGTIFTYFWPTMFVIPIGLFFHWLYFFMLDRRGVGVLVPGGIVFTAGVVCQVSMLFDAWGIMWPGFIFAVAIGLFELYWFGGRNKWLLIPINILAVLSLIFFAVFTIGSIFSNLVHLKPVLAMVMIMAGIGVLFVRRKETI